MALTKITGQVVDTTTDLVVGVTTVGGGVSAVDGFFSGILTAVGNASFSGSVSVGGTITYEDVTNVDLRRCHQRRFSWTDYCEKWCSSW